MMYQGLLGAFPFSVSPLEICTFRDYSRNHEQTYAEHKVCDGLPRLQYTGRNLDTAELAVIIAPVGVLSTVGLRLRALQALVSSGREMPLVMGLRYYGCHVLKSYKVTHRQMHFGVTLSAEVSLILQEYN